MRRRVPLNAVRAFEAAARHQSLAQAAQELCVTPTAISHHVRLLEEFLQVQLFDRKSGRVVLSASAQPCLAKLSEGLDLINAALCALGQNETRARLLVAASPSFTSLWLLPRLQRFVAVAPTVDVILSAVTGRNNFEDKSFDATISNWSPGSDQRVDRLMEEDVVPVCAPRLVARARAAGEDPLMTLPLIHEDKKEGRYGGAFPGWRRYLAEIGAGPRDTGMGLRFNQSSLAVEAAIEGYGMLLGRSCLVAPALAAGRLVRVTDAAYPTRFPYFLATRADPANTALQQFRSWLLTEAAA